MRQGKLNRKKILAGIIVLHYNTAESTIKCVDSLLSINNISNCIIVIYDNASPNDSFEHLKKKYNNINNIILARSDNNSGFSKGNNEAYRLIMDYNPKFVVTLNNDIIIRQNDFLSVLCKLENNYAVIGPDIFSPNMHIHQNPLYEHIPPIDHIESNIVNPCRKDLKNIEQATRIIKKYRFRKKIISHFPTSFYNGVKTFWFRLSGKSEELSRLRRHTYECINPVLQGSCIIFTRRYLNNYRTLFEPETNFYFEELLLAQRCKKEGLSTLYTPKLQVLHYHEVSTTSSFKSIENYINFYANNTINSFEIYKKSIR